ncbi:hypothetical protein HIM_01573 [Hirsutella minnesotensis 3608]|nr:hypothetical protein HIM_01573 [Hirsutella minnesotensis 3608]
MDPQGASRDIRRYFSAQPAKAMPPAMSKLRSLSSGSADDEDPLLGGAAHLRLPELRPGRSRSPEPRVSAPADTPSGRSRIAVYLTASPRQRPVSAGAKRKREGPDQDASSRFKPRLLIKETPVPIPKIPTWNKPPASAAATPKASSAPAIKPVTNSRGRPKGWKAGMSHVYIVHGGHEERWTCQWRRCAGCTPPRVFGSRDEFRAHVEQDHLVPLAWHVGDGPRNGPHGRRRKQPGEQGSDEEEVPDYLKDAQGQQVTPSIRGQELEDMATWRMNRRKLKELLMRRDENLPDEDSESSVDET